MDTQDRRVRRTQHSLAKALIALTLEKGYDAVTIRDITERADIGYATFFRHYRDKDGLLKDVLDVVLTEFIDLLRNQGTTTTGPLLFRYVEEHHEVVHVLLNSGYLRQQLIAAAAQTTFNEHSGHTQNKIPLEIASNHVVASSIALIDWWLAHKMPYPAEQMGSIYEELIIKPTTELAFLPKD
ncbi:TetR family transcriptional regulator [Dictyobacter alpinus]|uniref:TetR family transcriptional regulator n=1 Tax=Dictyobacter alpinus TaxID=2014873 RepID=A0A402BGK4_9CHLR|nr:TetR/AcrR family transcriptional regulator [Dictyobacter alpinus]GCE30544.1 TetR family transcriptional regulator [Dictyobacter alpinus]